MASMCKVLSSQPLRNCASSSPPNTAGVLGFGWKPSVLQEGAGSGTSAKSQAQFVPFS